ncbi:MAG: spore coat protein, partial [Desulfitobacteriaceae bacterium]|nr:spore coat protein [Desulfitobacteriaceae bacterium]
QDPQLKQLFSNLAQKEQEHLSSVNQLLSGQIPNVQQGQQQGQPQNQQQQQQQYKQQQQKQQQGQQMIQNQMQGAMANESDAALCNDMLATEKYVSSAYDTAIFENTNANVRQVLNHIQKEEQEHGEQIFNYMQQNGMYQVQQ